MAGPLLAAVLMGAWLAVPLSLLALCALLAVAAGALPPAREASAAPRAAQGGAAGSPQFWLLAAIAVVYAFAEGTFANWAVIFLADAKGLPLETAGAALSVFWGALVGGRLAVSALIARVPARAVWVTLPCLMLAAFLAIPQANGAAAGLAAFALAGFACSAFFPLTVALTSERFPAQVAWVSSMLTAALMLGVGLGSFAVGALRETLGLEQLYRLSAAYPALILALIGAVWLLGQRTRVARPA
jgi:fucose permease